MHDELLYYMNIINNFISKNLDELLLNLNNININYVLIKNFYLIFELNKTCANSDDNYDHRQSIYLSYEYSNYIRIAKKYHINCKPLNC